MRAVGVVTSSQCDRKPRRGSGEDQSHEGGSHEGGSHEGLLEGRQPGGEGGSRSRGGCGSEVCRERPEGDQRGRVGVARGSFVEDVVSPALTSQGCGAF